jgi:2-keto-4-pentenoate hydratase/2-oxohepta-3-ene-1,7-dioic acid hydratase in catechol pathway
MPRPGKIVCVGRNYLEHAKELGNALPVEPLLFLKPPSSVIGDGEVILLPPESAQVEHEAEIGVVIGARLHRVAPNCALAGVRGLTCVNDVTARDLQKKDGQWTRAKGFDTFCPMGPRVVALADLGDLADIEVIGRVNGVERQRGVVGQMQFGIAELIAYISRVMTLEPGDLIATGTPAGVGPLGPGDTVEVEVSGVGVLRNRVAAGG